MKNTKRKLLVISLLTLFGIILFLQAPEQLVEKILLPALIGIIYFPRLANCLVHIN
ncbi:hypothetical protein ACQV2R_01085 [Facklamia sp. P12937]|uniref:hypothetical protein n=1 Tax=Facklamia sp. P12937 TaxID=3421949 RepID=UPI003D1667C0